MLEAESAYVLMITSGHLEKQTHQTLICICPMLVFIEFIATAFHGEPPSPQYVVDHIDTNCRNNRPENLRWLTRLENALMNPITRKKIEFICGSIEAFLDNPSTLNSYDVERNFAWMRTVTSEEAKNCKERMSLWASSNKKPRGGSWDKWVYESIIEKSYLVVRLD
ncbi:HNH endonuclease signature motif containing protein [Legionella sainthelensi]|nr:HNH endonuclease signature motif containing protein [Legionella sainthelensi]